MKKKVIKLLLDTVRPGYIFPKNPSVVFTAKVIESGRITVPDVEREALGIKPGDLVQVAIWKLKEGKESEDSSHARVETKNA